MSQLEVGFFIVSYKRFFIQIAHSLPSLISSLMPECDAQSQSTLKSNTTRTAETSGSTNVSLDSRVSACEKLVEEAIEKDLPATTLADSLKELGLKAVEAIDYLKEFNQRVAIHHSKAKQPGTPPCEQSNKASDHPQNHEDCDNAVKEAAWASLCAKLESTIPIPSSSSPSGVLDQVFELLGQEAPSSTTLSKSVLAVAPHLANDEDTVFEDSYLGKTQNCKLAYASQKPFENLIIRA